MTETSLPSPALKLFCRLRNLLAIYVDIIVSTRFADHTAETLSYTFR